MAEDDYTSHPYHVETPPEISLNFDSLSVLEGGKLNDGLWELVLDKQSLQKISASKQIKKVNKFVTPEDETDENIFPPEGKTGWNASNFGPLYIPAHGDSVHLSAANIPFYRRIIEVYEGHLLSVSPEGEIFIDKESTEYYTFGQNYFCVLGDNRSNSSDSRYWGFLPEDHVVGRASLVLYSFGFNNSGKRSVRWNRIFKSPG